MGTWVCAQVHHFLTVRKGPSDLLFFLTVILFFLKHTHTHTHIYIYIYDLFWLCWIFIAASGPFLQLQRAGDSLVVVCGLLIAVASLFFCFLFFSFLAALGLCRCMWAFSGCSWWGLLSSCRARASPCSGFLVERRRAPVATVHGLGCSAARGIFPEQGSDPRPLRWRADS